MGSEGQLGHILIFKLYEGLPLELLRCHFKNFFKVAKRQAGSDIEISSPFVQSVFKLLSPLNSVCVNLH